jgi:thioredoxin 1
VTATHEYAPAEPTRSEIDSLRGALVLEFGSPWCGHCRRAQPLLDRAFEHHSRVRHIKISDARGRPLGRSFGVTLWPTLVFLKNGREISRLVRPTDVEDIRKALVEMDRA